MNTMQEQLKTVSKEMFRSYNVDQDIKHIDNKMSKNIIISNNIENKINVIENKEIVHSNIEKGIAMNKTNYNKSIEVIRAGIYYMRLHIDIEGSEQGGKRPVIVIQNDIGNKYSSNIIVVPITSSTIKNPLPTHVKINGYGLTKESTVLCEMPMTLSKKRILSYVGTVDELTMKQVDRAHEIATSKLQPKSALEKLPQNLKNMINEKLEDIRSIERTICTIINNDESLEENLKGQRECYLASLERICKKYNLNYRDYYTMYKREKEEERIVV